MDDFTVKLGGLTTGNNTFSFDIKDSFFEAYNFSDLKYANINAYAKIKKTGENMSLNLVVNGKINQLACDICTDKLSVTISAETDIIIKKSNEELVSTDEIFYIKYNENKLDLKHLIFELIVINIPKKIQHATDKNGNSTCNKEMIDLLAKYTQVQKRASDSRWDALKKIKLK